MHSLLPNRPYAGAILLAALCLLAGADAAHAHRLKLFATAEGETISGRAYFPGGGKAKNVRVEVLGPDGVGLGEVTTDTEGRFAFQARYGCDHTFVAETPDGHRSSYKVGADELAQDLPPLSTPSAQPPARKRLDVMSGYPGEEAQSGAMTTQGQPGSLRTELQSIVEKAVSRQVQPLREQLERHENKVRLHDILAGIGYIVGIMGVVFYFLGCSRRRAARDEPG